MRFHALDGWRGVAALLVATFHLSFTCNCFGPLPRGGWLYVDFFFVLSGFVLAFTYADRITGVADLLRFIVRRFGRLAPVHVAAFVLVLGFEAIKLLALRTGAAEPGTIGSLFAIPNITTPLLREWLKHVLMFNGILPNWQLNAPSWSISTEYYCYIVFGTICLLARPRLTLIAACLAAIGAAVVMAFSRTLMDVTVGLGFFRCIYGFFCGVLVYFVWQRVRLPEGTGTIAESAVALGAWLFVLNFASSTWSYLTPLVSACVVWVFAQERGRISLLMRTRPIAALGRWSYSLYMLHWVFVLGFIALDPMYKLRGTHAATAYGYTALVTSIAMAALSYRFIERPARDFFNRVSDRIDPAIVQKMTRGWSTGKPAGAPRIGE